LFGILMSMSVKTMNLIGNGIYAIGALVLILSCASFVFSAGMVILAGPVVILFPVVGGVLFGVGKGMIDKSKS
jgi:hypothetical protein